MENCPICNNQITIKNIKDCGYNTFNIGNVTCNNCNFRIEYRCVENEQSYIELWDKNVLNIKKIFNLSNEEKNDFFKFLVIKNTNEIIKSFEVWDFMNSKKDEFEKNSKIILDNNLNLEINEKCEILVPKSLLNHGYLTILKELGITLKIKEIKG